MKFFIIFVVAVLAGIGYIRATNKRMLEEAETPESASRMPTKIGVLVIATIVAVTEITELFTGEIAFIGLIIAAMATVGLAFFQFLMATKEQTRAVTGIAFAVGIAAMVCKAGKFDVAQIYNEGLHSILSLLATLIAPVIFVGVCGIVRRAYLSGRFNFRTTSDDDSDDETSDDDSDSDSDGEEGRVSGGEIIKTLLPYLALLLVLILIGIGTYVVVTMIKGGM